MHRTLMFYTLALALLFPVDALAAQSGPLQVEYVYQLDNRDPTAFDFAAGPVHACKSNLYRVYSRSEAAAARKFAMVMAAFSNDWPLLVNVRPGCDGNRAKVGWVRLTKTTSAATVPASAARPDQEN